MYEELLNDFDEGGLDPDNTVVRCSSQYEAEIFLEYLCAKGAWSKEDIEVLKEGWGDHEHQTCYHLSGHGWCYDSWYEKNRPSFLIVDFCDIHRPRT